LFAATVVFKKTSLWSMCTPCVAKPRSMRATEVTFVFAGRVILTVNVDPYATVAGNPLSVGRVLVRYGGERYSTPNK
jgi:hypothetical protein